MRLMMNSRRARPTPSLRHAREVERAVGVADVHHDLDGERRQRVELDLLALELELALVDVAGVAFGAGHGDVLAFADRVGRVAAADDRRNAELARDDRRVAGAPAAIGDDGGGALHHRFPVRDRSCRRPARRRAARAPSPARRGSTRAGPAPICWPMLRPSASTLRAAA